ncbi:MAG: calcium/sodium antiporter [Candidatus Altiarchaeota archaeon]
MNEYLSVVFGLALLYKGADYLVGGSSSLARRAGVPPLVVGLTIVAFGTSMPELIVNLFASFQGKADVAYGNILGSNIFNILLILGAAATIMPLEIRSSIVRKEIPFALLAVIVLFAASNEQSFYGGGSSMLSRTDGIILTLFFVAYLNHMRRLVNEGHDVSKTIPEAGGHSKLKILSLIVGGLVALFFGGMLTVDGAVAIARQLGVSELLIASTIVAGGTSLPELATSVVAAVKKEMDLSVGNIVGSNIFNIFLILGVSALVSPLAVPAGINFDFTVLLITTILLLVFSITQHKIDRKEGITFLLLYAAYVALIIQRG